MTPSLTPNIGPILEYFSSVREFVKMSKTQSSIGKNNHFDNVILNNISNEVHVYLNMFFVPMLK